MATGRYFAALGYKTYVALGTTASSMPTSSTGMTRIMSLDNTGIQGTSESASVLDYDSELGFRAKLITAQDYSIPCSLNLDVSDTGYRLLKTASLRAAEGVLLQWYRETPVTDGSTSNPEVHAGLAQVTEFSEDIGAGNIAKVRFTLSGYSDYLFFAQGKAASTLTITSAGSGLTAGTYSGIALTPVNPIYGIGSGKGLTANVVVAAGGTVTAIPTIVSGGTNFRVGDTVSPALADVGGGTGNRVVPVFTVATVPA